MFQQIITPYDINLKEVHVDLTLMIEKKFPQRKLHCDKLNY